jgi:hypothetical protein
MQLLKMMNLAEVITIATELGIRLASFIALNKGVHLLQFVTLYGHLKFKV